MRKKHVIVAGAITAATLVMSGVTTTPVFAGVTKEQMQAQDDENLKDAFTGVSIGNLDIAYGVLNTVATKTGIYDQDNNRYIYAVTDDFPLNYRMYFNKNKQGTSGEEHSLSGGYNIFRIFPNGTEPVAYDDADYANKVGTDNVDEWPFPNMNGVQTMRNSQIIAKIKTILTNSAAKVLYEDGDGVDVGNYENATSITDAKKGVLAWDGGLQLCNPGEYYYTTYDTDDHGNAYYTSNLTIKDIVGRPGDKLVVKICKLNLGGNVSGWTFMNYPMTPLTNGGTDDDWEHVNLTPADGLKVIPGCIYIPYEVTYDMNGATGTAPTVPTGEYFTCDHRTVENLPDQGDMVKDGMDDVELIGWTDVAVTDVITNEDNIPTDMKKPGEEYTIPEGKRENVTLYAVWAKKGIVDAGLGHTSNGLSLWEWIIGGGIVGGIITGIAIRQRRRRRQQPVE